MLVARGKKELGAAHLDSTLVFARGVWMNVIDRAGLVLDTRFAPAARGEPRAGTCLFLLQKGTFRAEGASFEGPSAFTMSEQHLEGARGVRSLTFKTEGSPFTAIEMHFAASDAAPPPPVPTQVALPSSAWKAIAGLIDLARARSKDDELGAAVLELVVAVAETGVVSPRVADHVLAPIPFERLWRAVRMLGERFALSATLDQLGAVTETSPRQVDRYAREFFRSFPLVGGTWRSTTVHLRVKLAAMFLSAEGAAIADVAAAVGYGSTEAMARAFRDAGLPSPSTIRDALTSAR